MVPDAKEKETGISALHRPLFYLKYNTRIYKCQVLFFLFLEISKKISYCLSTFIRSDLDHAACRQIADPVSHLLMEPFVGLCSGAVAGIVAAPAL